MSKSFAVKALALPLLLAAASQPASAVADIGFESGTAAGWSTVGSTAVVSTFGSYTPVWGDWFGVATSGTQNVYSTFTRSIGLTAGQSIRLAFAFLTQDYAPFNDDAYLSVNGTPIFTASVASVGNFGSTPWQTYRFVAPSAGQYTVEVGVANRVDGAVSSFALVDAVVPEPATWALLIAGFGMVGFASRRRVVGTMTVQH